MFFSRLRLGEADNGHLGIWCREPLAIGEAKRLWPKRCAARRSACPSADWPEPGPPARIADDVDLAVAGAALRVDENPGICIGDPSIFQAQTFDERRRVGGESDMLAFERCRAPLK